MQKVKIFWLLFFLNLFVVQNNLGQSVRLLNTDDGLSNNIIFDIEQDDQGFLWFATENGLNRYDGYSFKKFQNITNDTTSIISNVCRNILKDTNGRLWIATKNGLSLYNAQNSSFTNYTIDTKDFLIQELEQNKEGKIWFNTLAKSGYFDQEKEEFFFIDEKYSSFNITISSNNVWVVSEEGSLDVIDENTLALKNLNTNIGIRKQIHFGKYTKKLWIPILDNSIHNILEIPKIPNNYEATKILEINKNTLLIGTNNGLFEYKINQKELKKVNFFQKETILNQQIRSLFKDSVGNIWVGTLGGVFQIDYLKKKFNHLKPIPYEENIVMGLTAGEQNLYFNNFGKGLYKYNINKKESENLNLKPSKTKENLFIWDIKQIKEDNNKLWLATNDGLIRYDAVANKSNIVKLPKGEDFYTVSFNFFDSQDNYIWVSSRTGIHQIPKSNPSNPKLSVTNAVEVSSIQKILETDNKVFVATEGKGLFYFDITLKTITPIYFSKKKKEIIDTTIWDMILVNDYIFIGTNNGLYKLNKSNLDVSKIDRIQNIIFSIQKDDFDRLWMGTDKGLLSYNLRTKFIDHFTKSEGVTNIEFNRRSKTKTKDGKFWFGGVNGITYFDPSAIKQNKHKPPVYVTKLEVITPDSTFIPNLRKDKSIVLPYYQNTISLEYVALNYTNSIQNKYKYQLIGRDKNWVDDKGTRFSRYVQIPPGKYIFKVIASNNDGLWNEKGDSISIEITPPFWQTIWFRILTIFLILVITFGIYKYRVNRLLAIERMKLRIASDLHDEVGSGLSGIALTSDILEQQFQHGNVKPQLLSRITKNARYLASTLDDIVWLINPEKELLEDFILKVKTVSREILAQTQVDFIDEILINKKNRLIKPDQKRNLFLFTKEAINNIAKHADAKKVIISFKLYNSFLILSIEDDGKGFDVNKKTIRNGLQTMKNRAKALKGNLDITSKQGKGTKLILQIKIP